MEKPLPLGADFKPTPRDEQFIALQVFTGSFFTKIVTEAIAQETACARLRADYCNIVPGVKTPVLHM